MESPEGAVRKDLAFAVFSVWDVEPLFLKIAPTSCNPQHRAQHPIPVFSISVKQVRTFAASGWILRLSRLPGQQLELRLLVPMKLMVQLLEIVSPTLSVLAPQETRLHQLFAASTRGNTVS
ncbi:hypothetical protein TCAL_11240, partial [Tigriopus californicus]|eukprot:TCALIF_11240-PA protein Name:"Protein of unknown function" AED:0.01 eAED:0.01 QI:0/1/0.75/1/0/0.5/4/0/120